MSYYNLAHIFYIRDSPSGKATDSDSVIGGSNPSSRTISDFHLNLRNGDFLFFLVKKSLKKPPPLGRWNSLYFYISIDWNIHYTKIKFFRVYIFS